MAENESPGRWVALKREYAGVAFLLLVALVFCMQTFGIPRALKAGPVDAMVYAEASQRLQAGGDELYEQPGWEVRGQHYIYPHPFAALFTPFSWFDDRPDMDPRDRSLLRPYPFPSMLYVWVFLHALAWALAMWLLARALSNDPAARFRIAAVASLAIYGALFLDAAFGNVNVFILLALAAAWLLIDRGKPLSGGVLLGVAAMAKIMPGMLLPVLILQRRWKACAGFLLGALLMWLLPLVVLVPKLGLVDGLIQNCALTWKYIDRMLLPKLTSQEYGGETSFIMFNTSVTAALHRLFGEGVPLMPAVWDKSDMGPLLFALPKPLLRVVGLLVPLGMYLLALHGAWKHRGDRRAVLGFWGLAFMAASAMNVLFWHYHFIGFALPVAVLALEAREDRTVRAPFLLALALLVMLCGLAPLAATVNETRGIARLLVWGLPTAGFLASWFICRSLLLRGVRRRAS